MWSGLVPKGALLIPAPSVVSAIAWLLVTVTSFSLVVPLVTARKDRGFGDTVTKLPLRLRVCGLPAALSFIASVPVCKPPPVGVKVTEMVQLFPAANVALQLLVCAKSPAVAMLAIASGAFPVLLRVTIFAVLVEPTA